jgi:type VI secretion system protein ImpC
MSTTDSRFTILALAPVGSSASSRRSYSCDLYGLDDVIASVKPTIEVEVPKDLVPAGVVSFSITSIKDFKPDRLALTATFLRRLIEAGSFIDDALSQGMSLEKMVDTLRKDWGDLSLALPDASIPETAPPAPEGTTVDDLLSMVAQPAEAVRSASGAATTAPIKQQIDDRLSKILSVVYNNNDFRKCETTWRGIELLLKQGPVKTSQGLEVNLVPVTFETIKQTLAELSAELAVKPPNLVLVDLPLVATVEHLDLFEQLASFGEGLLAPTIVWVESGFFHISDWSELSRLPYLKHYFDDTAFAKWRKLQQEPAADWLAVTCNRFIGRLNYGTGNPPTKVPLFNEQDALWLSPVWAIGALIAQSMNQFGWPSRFTDISSVHLDALPLPTSGNPVATEMAIGEDRLVQFVEVGLIPLVAPLGKDRLFIPQETSVASGSISIQLLMSRIFSFFFWCEKNVSGVPSSDNPAQLIRDAIALQWQKTGHPLPDDFEITADPFLEDGSLLLHIRFTTPSNLIRKPQMFEFDFRFNPSVQPKDPDEQ